MYPLADTAADRRAANEVEIRMAALDAASRVHQRVSVPNNNHTTTARDSMVLASSAAYERYLRTGEYEVPR